MIHYSENTQELDGGYDRGYRESPCFWGKNPGSLVVWLTDRINVNGLSVLDAGCGEGKNAVHFAKRGAKVLGWDSSSIAIRNGLNTWGNFPKITWQHGDVRTANLPENGFDIVVAYGLFHCLKDTSEVQNLFHRFSASTERGGYHVICAFNDRRQDFRGAHADFDPLLLPHSYYLSLYDGWEIMKSSDEDLTEVHPNDRIKHTHSLSRIVARKNSD